MRMSDARTLLRDSYFGLGPPTAGAISETAIVWRWVIIEVFRASFAGRLCSLRWDERDDWPGDAGASGLLSLLERRLKMDVDRLRSEGDWGCSRTIILRN